MKYFFIGSITAVCLTLGSFTGQAKSVISPEDITFIGGFRTSASASYARGLTHRYIDGQLYFYTVSGAGGDSVGLASGATTPIHIWRTCSCRISMKHSLKM